MSEAEFGPGQLLLFDRRTAHALPQILEEPRAFLAVDNPAAEAPDIVFAGPDDSR